MSKNMRFNIVLLIFSAVCFFYVIPEYTADMATKNDFGPQLFPKLSVAVSGLAALLLVFLELIQKNKEKEENNHGTNDLLRYFQAFIYVFSYIAAVATLGFYSSSFALAVFYFRRLPKKKYVTCIFILLILFLLIWLLFEKMMKLELPSGLLF